MNLLVVLLYLSAFCKTIYNIVPDKFSLYSPYYKDVSDMLVLSLIIFNACHVVSLKSDGLAGLFYEMKQPSRTFGSYSHRIAFFSNS